MSCPCLTGASMTVDLVATDEALWASRLESRSECGGPQADQPDSASRVSQRLDVDLASLDGFGQRVRGLSASCDSA